MDAAARALGLPAFEEKAFNEKVSAVRVPENGILIFSLVDGRDVTVEWRHKSRGESWTPEMRKKARERGLANLQKTEEMV